MEKLMTSLTALRAAHFAPLDPKPTRITDEAVIARLIAAYNEYVEGYNKLETDHVAWLVTQPPECLHHPIPDSRDEWSKIILSVSEGVLSITIKGERVNGHNYHYRLHYYRRKFRRHQSEIWKVRKPALLNFISREQVRYVTRGVQ